MFVDHRVGSSRSSIAGLQEADAVIVASGRPWGRYTTTGDSTGPAFADAGGISEGFRQAGFDVVAGSDVDPDACATYGLNFPEATTISGDLRSRGVRAKMLSVSRGSRCRCR